MGYLSYTRGFVLSFVVVRARTGQSSSRDLRGLLHLHRASRALRARGRVSLRCPRWDRRPLGFPAPCVLLKRCPSLRERGRHPCTRGCVFVLKLHLLGTVLSTSFQTFPRVYSQGAFTIIQNGRSGEGSRLHYGIREREVLERGAFSLNVTERSVTRWDQTQVVWVLTDTPMAGDVVCRGARGPLE